MIFAVQRFLEDHFERRGLVDVDQYAVKVANLYERLPAKVTNETLARELARQRTTFFRRNRAIDRKPFKLQLASMLRRKFKKKSPDPALREFEQAVRSASRRLQKRRRSMAALLSEFSHAVERHSIDMFWLSRTKGRLRAKPEKIAQGLLAAFARGALGAKSLIVREMASGIGFVDVAIAFGAVPHLIELKILTGKLTGAKQLGKYMRTEGKREGWLVLIDVRDSTAKAAIPSTVATEAGVVRTVVVDVKPSPPHEA